MKTSQITDRLSVGPQITIADVAELKRMGFRSILSNRPDGEVARPAELRRDRGGGARGRDAGAAPARRQPRLGGGRGGLRRGARRVAGARLRPLPLGRCAPPRSGRSPRRRSGPCADILGRAKAAGYDMSGVARRIAIGGRTPDEVEDARHDVVIVGAGAAGISVAASLKSRKPDLDIAIIDPADMHYYQPGWTMVGGGIFEAPRHRPHHGIADPAGGALDQGRRRRLRARARCADPRRLPRAELRAADRLPGPQARLGRRGGAGGHAGPQRRDLELPLRPGALHLAARAGPRPVPGGLHPAAHADQVRRRAAEGDLPVGRRLAAARRAEGHRHPVHATPAASSSG